MEFIFIKRRVFLLTIFISIAWIGWGQKIKYSKEMLHKMELAEVDIFEPTEGKYRSRYSAKNDFQKIDHTIISKKEKLEIRYAIIPYRENDPTTQVPHVDFMRVISSVAPNEENVPVTVHEISEEDLKDKFNANWGHIAFFKPKPSFSEKKHCRLLSLYGAKRGMVYVFYLFDEPSEALDIRMQAFRFKTSL